MTTTTIYANCSRCGKAKEASRAKSRKCAACNDPSRAHTSAPAATAAKPVSVLTPSAAQRALVAKWNAEAFNGRGVEVEPTAGATPGLFTSHTVAAVSAPARPMTNVDDAYAFICRLDAGDAVPFDAPQLRHLGPGYVMGLLDALRGDGFVELTNDVRWVRTDID